MPGGTIDKSPARMPAHQDRRSFAGHAECRALWPVRALGDPSAQLTNFVLRQGGKLLPLAHRRHFEIFHLILDEPEQWAGVGFAGNDGGLAPLATLEQ